MVIITPFIGLICAKLVWLKHQRAYLFAPISVDFCDTESTVGPWCISIYSSHVLNWYPSKIRFNLRGQWQKVESMNRGELCWNKAPWTILNDTLSFIRGSLVFLFP